jgi:hypothetical protein
VYRILPRAARAGVTSTGPSGPGWGVVAAAAVEDALLVVLTALTAVAWCRPRWYPIA